MNKDQVISILRENASELRAAGVAHLRLFGSVARGEAGAHSDVDILADFDAAKRVTLVTLGSLEHRLHTMLGAKVDLSSAIWMREHVRAQAVSEAVLVF